MTDIQNQIREYAEYVERVAPQRQAASQRRRLPRFSMAVAAAALIIIAVGFAAIFAPMGIDDPVVEEPAPTTVPVTTAPAPSTTIAATATPSISWTRLDDPLFAEADGRIESLSLTAFGYMAGGSGGRDAMVWVSPDGETWEQVGDSTGAFGPAHSPYGDTGLRSIQGLASKAGRTVAVGYEIAGDRPEGSRPWNQDDWEQLEPVAAVWYTDDGVVWERVEQDPEVFGSTGAHRMLSVAATDDWFVAVGDGVWRSSDGIVWTRLAGPGARLWDVIATSVGFAAAGGDPSNMQIPGIWSSVDGTVWEPAVVDFTQLTEGIAHQAVAYALTQTDTGFLAAGRVGNAGTQDAIVWRSDDGLTWEVAERKPLGKWEWLAGVAADGTKALAVGTQEWNSAVGLVWESTDDGLTWTLSRDPAFEMFGSGWAVANDVIIHDGRLIVAGAENDHPAVWIGEWTEEGT